MAPNSELEFRSVLFSFEFIKLIITQKNPPIVLLLMIHMHEHIYIYMLRAKSVPELMLQLAKCDNTLNVVGQSLSLSLSLFSGSDFVATCSLFFELATLQSQALSLSVVWQVEAFLSKLLIRWDFSLPSAGKQ